MSGWGFAEGDEIGPRRRAVSLLGGGLPLRGLACLGRAHPVARRGEAVRPDQTEDAVARRTLAAEAAMLDRLAHPLLVRSFGSEPTARGPPACSSSSRARACPR